MAKARATSVKATVIRERRPTPQEVGAYLSDQLQAGMALPEAMKAAAAYAASSIQEEVADLFTELLGQTGGRLGTLGTHLTQLKRMHSGTVRGDPGQCKQMTQIAQIMLDEVKGLVLELDELGRETVR